MLTFLELIGLGVQATDRELAEWIINFSRGLSPTEVAEMIRLRSAAVGGE